MVDVIKVPEMPQAVDGIKVPEMPQATDLDGLCGFAENPDNITAGVRFNYSKDTTLAESSDVLVSTQSAVKTYVDTGLSGKNPLLSSDINNALNNADSPSVTNPFATKSNLITSQVINDSNINKNLGFTKGALDSLAHVVSTTVLQRIASSVNPNGAITIASDPSKYTFSFDLITLNNASIVIGNTVTITILLVPYAFTVSATQSGANFVKGATASDTASNLALAINTVLPSTVFATPNGTFGAGTVYVKDLIGGYAGNNYLMSTNNATGFILTADHFVGGGSKAVNLPEVKIIATNAPWNPTEIKTSLITVPAESNVNVNLDNKIAYFSVNFDQDLNIIQYEVSPGIFSNFTQSINNPRTTIDFRSKATIGVAIFGSGLTIDSVTDFSSCPAGSLGDAIFDKYIADKNGGSDLGSIIAGDADKSLQSVQSIEYLPEINPLDRFNPDSKTTSGSVIKECIGAYRFGTGANDFVYAKYTSSNPIQFRNDIFDDITTLPLTPPALPVNTYPSGIVSGTNWMHRFFYRNPIDGSEYFQWGQNTSAVTPTIATAQSDFASLVKAPLLPQEDLHSIAYFKKGSTNYSLSTSMISFSYKQLVTAGITGYVPFVPFLYPKVMFFASNGTDGNNGSSIEYPKTLLGAETSAIAAGGSITLINFETSSFSDDLVFTNNINMYAPAAYTLGNLTFGTGTEYLFAARVIGRSGKNLTFTNTSTANVTFVGEDITFTNVNFTAAYVRLYIENCKNSMFTNVSFTGTAGGYIHLNTLRHNAMTVIGNDATNDTVHFYGCYIVGAQNFTNVTVLGNISRVLSPITFTNCILNLTVNSIEGSGSISNSGSSGYLTILNRNEKTIPPSTDILNIINTQLPAYDKFFVSTTSADNWYRIGDQSDITKICRYEAILETYSSTGRAKIKIIVFADSTGYVDRDLTVLDGLASVYRPKIRVYNDTSGKAIIYARIPFSTAANIFSDSRNFDTFYFNATCLDSGTGADPVGTSSYTLKYDSTTDDGCYSVSKSVLFFGPYTDTAPSKIQISKTVGNEIILRCSGISKIGDGTSKYLFCAAGTVPLDYRPVETEYKYGVTVRENSSLSSDTPASAIVLPDGSIVIYKNFSDSFTSVSGQFFTVRPFSMTIYKSDT